MSCPDPNVAYDQRETWETPQPVSSNGPVIRRDVVESGSGGTPRGGYRAIVSQPGGPKAGPASLVLAGPDERPDRSLSLALQEGRPGRPLRERPARSPAPTASSFTGSHNDSPVSAARCTSATRFDDVAADHRAVGRNRPRRLPCLTLVVGHVRVGDDTWGIVFQPQQMPPAWL